MSAEPKQLLRTLALLWARLGSLRLYFVVVLALVLLLAAVGLWHLIAPANRSVAAPNKAVAGIAPGIQSTSPVPTSPPSATPAVPQLERAIAITDVTEAEERGPRGETFIVAKIGMASQTPTEKDKVEIHVAFFDLDANNQMRPTDAQVTYQWITQVRDWSDPTPKYLAATYLNRRHSREQLRYGGFVVRVYCDGKLQDTRSKPETLLAALRNNAPQQTRSPSITPIVSPTPAMRLASPPILSSASPAVSPTDHSSPVTDHSSESLPKGIPVPGKPGFVQSPYDPKFLIDVRGFPPGTLVNDPNTNKPFRVP